MPRPRARGGAHIHLWDHACLTWPQLADRNAAPLLSIDPGIEAALLALRGATRASFVAGLDECLDRLIAHERFAVQSASRKSSTAKPTHEVRIAGTPMAVRLVPSGALRIDVLGIGGRVSGDEIQLDDLLPISLAQGAVGRRLADVVSVPPGLLDGDRVVTGVSRRFKARTAFTLSPIPLATPTYRQLVGPPSKRFEHLRVSYRCSNR